jgi:glycerol-3-phosphate dehydrogenase
MLARATARDEPWDMIVVGGGATGVGVAVDAASRGYDTLLLEAHDFGKGASSRSTKLAHGGVRYLERGNVSLVIESLRERGIMRRNAPHVVSDLAFVVPSYDWWEAPFYGVGLKAYDLLAGRYGFGRSKILSRRETLSRLPTIRTDGLRGGVVYFDGRFDDARLLVNLAATAAEQGGTLLNYAPVSELTIGADGFVDGALARDLETGTELRARARVVVNATGVFADAVRRLADPQVRSLVVPSQGVHVVLDGAFLPGDTAVLVPHTSDGRVLFAIPWHGRTLVGTTDTPLEQPVLEPRAGEDEIDFVLETAGQYLAHAPRREDVLCVFAGVRPLVREANGRHTAALARDHLVHVDPAGLVTITGGKWTTYRSMAEDCVDQAATLGGLPERPCATRELNIHGFHRHPERFGNLAVYGSDAFAIAELARSEAPLGELLHPALPALAAEVVWAAREEMARTVEDVMARRTRSLFLDARAAAEAAPRAAALLAQELERDDEWQRGQVASFRELAACYTLAA